MLVAASQDRHYDSRTRLPGLTLACERVLDATVVGLATWTVVYHLCLTLRLDVIWALALQACALTAMVLLWRAHQQRHTDVGAVSVPDPMPTGGGTSRRSSWPDVQLADAGFRSPEGVLTGVTVIAAAAAAVTVAFDGPWPAVAATWMLASAAAVARAVLRLRGPVVSAPQPCSTEPVIGRGVATGTRRRSIWKTDPTGVAPALGWAFALAILSIFTRWPNPDDIYYVNLSQWVAEHGNFPLRDTIFSDLRYPMSSWPPMASYDALAGTVAWLGAVQAASVIYYVVPPLATFLSVLALWRLLRAWRVEHITVALSFALLFLLFDGGPGYAAPGNLFLIRIWQGKVILLCLLVPLLLVYAVRYVERPTWGRAGWLCAGGVAAVGLSTTAMFLVPLLALGGSVPLALRRPAAALGGFVAMAGYPLVSGAATVVLGGRSADLFDSRDLFRFEPSWFGPEILRDGPFAAVTVVAVLIGSLLVRHRAAALTTATMTLILGVTFIPGVTVLSYDLVGLGPTLWRVSWGASIAALVGVLGAHLVTPPTPRRVRVAGPVALASVLVLFGVPLWSERNEVSLDAPFHWQRGPEATATARVAIDAARPGDLILAPQELSITISISTTQVKTVAARDYFLDYLKDVPSFHFEERLTLFSFANPPEETTTIPPGVARALTVLDVDQVCLPADAPESIRFVRSLGYRLAASSAWDRCLTR